MKMRRLQKGQAAIEFLITYGWAFSIILLALGTLLYTGVFDLSIVHTNTCEFTSGIICAESRADGQTVDLFLQNTYPIELTQVQVTIPECGLLTGPSSLSPGESALYTRACSLDGGVLRTTIEFNYTNPDSLVSHTQTGRFTQTIS
ncbi:MAG: hypothetical protein ACMXYF_00775 [Candidatus Woesearchaeota archaeon]